MNLTGQFLISMPSLEDDRFEKTVIYMCAHSKDGAMGCLLYTSPSPRDGLLSRMPSSA